MLRWAPMENPKDYCYDIELCGSGLRRRGSVVGSWLLDLTDVLRSDGELSKFGGGVNDSGEGRWTVHTAVDLGVPAPVISTALFERFNSRRLGEFKPCPEWDAIYVWGTSCSLMFLEWIAIPFVLSTIYFGIRKVKITTTRQTSTTEMEPPTRTLVIFGVLEICVKENLFQL